MRCPKCGFHSFDYLDACKKCNTDLRPYKVNKGVASTVAPAAPSLAPLDTLPAPAFEPPPPSPTTPFSVPTGINLEEPGLDAPPVTAKIPPASSPAPSSAPLSIDLDLGSLEETKVALPEGVMDDILAPPTPAPGAPKVPEFTLDFGPPPVKTLPQGATTPAAIPVPDLVIPPPSPEPLPLLAPVPAPEAPSEKPFNWVSSASTVDAGILSLPRGGFWIRFVAQIIDGVVLQFVLTLIFIILFFALGLEQMLPKPGQSPQQMGESLGSFFLLIIFAASLSLVFNAAYFIYFHGAKGQTPGKMLCKLKVIQDNGQEMTYGKSLVRYLGYIVNQFTLMIGFLWAAFDKDKQGLHDKIAKTLVVKLG